MGRTPRKLTGLMEVVNGINEGQGLVSFSIVIEKIFMKLIFYITFGVTVLYTGLAFLLFAFQRSLLYQPSIGEISPNEFGLAEMRPVTLKTEDGLSLLAWYKPPDNTENLTFLFLHGNAGHIGHRAKKIKPFMEHGYGILLLSYRGYGPNPGLPREKSLYLDGQSGIKFLKDQKIPISKLVLYGESLGSGVAVELAQNIRISALILEAPFTSMIDAAKHHFGLFPVKLLLFDTYDSMSKIRNIKTRLLILHGKKDLTVPFKLGIKLFEFGLGQKDFFEFPDAGHNNLYDYGAAKRIIKYLDQN